jgi:hypothetical protein
MLIKGFLAIFIVFFTRYVYWWCLLRDQKDFHLLVWWHEPAGICLPEHKIWVWRRYNDLKTVVSGVKKDTIFHLRQVLKIPFIHTGMHHNYKTDRFTDGDSIKIVKFANKKQKDLTYIVKHNNIDWEEEYKLTVRWTWRVRHSTSVCHCITCPHLPFELSKHQRSTDMKTNLHHKIPLNATNNTWGTCGSVTRDSD